MNETLPVAVAKRSLSTVPVDIIVQKILLGCLLFSLAIFTVFGNLLILYAIRTEKRLRTVSNLFILSLAFADLVVGVFVMPLSAANIIAGRWPFSSVLCQMWLSVDYVASTASIFNLVLLSLDRYWAVVYPLRYFQNRSRRRATNFIMIVWFMSFLWAPVVIFWSLLVPQHSDMIKPTECDTSFRSSKIFKTAAAFVNFYLPLLAMIIISCRIMVAVRSRSTMEFGRRISAATQRQMKLERATANAAAMRGDNPTQCSTEMFADETNGLTASIVAPINRMDSEINEDTELSSPCPNEDDTESLGQVETEKSPLHRSMHFCFPSIKPIRTLFPSLLSLREPDERKSGQTPRRSSSFKIMETSLTVANDMKPPGRLSNILSASLNHIPRTFSITSLSDECPQTIFVYPLEKKRRRSADKITVQITSTSSSSSPTHVGEGTNASNVRYLSVPASQINQPPKMNILTFFDYIINPSLSSSMQKELKAARQLGLLVGVFTLTWLPYFILFLLVAWCQHCVSDTVFTASIWLGYLNSTCNPLIYPLCNIHFRRAFKKIFYCQHAKSKLPNLNTLRDLRTLHQS